MGSNEQSDSERHLRELLLVVPPLLQKFRALLSSGDFVGVEGLGNGEGLSAGEIEIQLAAIAVTPLETPKIDNLVSTRRMTVLSRSGIEILRMQDRVWIEESDTPDLAADLSLVRCGTGQFALNVHGLSLSQFDPEHRESMTGGKG